MQRREDDGRSTITLSRNGATPGYVGGSSAATATLAGIAALVWATDPYPNGRAGGRPAEAVGQHLSRTER